jgi:hypothetical protein
MMALYKIGRHNKRGVTKLTLVTEYNYVEP